MLRILLKVILSLLRRLALASLLLSWELRRLVDGLKKRENLLLKEKRMEDEKKQKQEEKEEEKFQEELTEAQDTQDTKE